MKSLTLPLAVLAALALSSTAVSAHAGNAHAVTAATAASTASAAAATTVNAKQAATRAVLRDLWVEHVFWTRNYVMAGASSNAAQQKVATDQVIANATAISGAVASFYGKPAGDRMLALLAGHWGAVKAHADATFAKDAKGQERATATLLSNAREIATFLAGANPNLPEPTLVGLLSAHGAHHVTQNQQIAKGDFAGEARTWDSMRTHMFTIADALGDAIAKQFPAKF